MVKRSTSTALDWKGGVKGRDKGTMLPLQRGTLAVGLPKVVDPCLHYSGPSMRLESAKKAEHSLRMPFGYQKPYAGAYP